MGKIASWLKGAKRLYVQEFKPTAAIQDKNILYKKPISAEELEGYKTIAKKSIPRVNVRWT
ncbi:MAG: hypothetical protein O2779_05385 [Nanoarchaeota archaeon]|nr:hypothetical protein [Nanoarchaeota archaeon]